MTPSQTALSFSVDGGFITTLARTWFWDERRPYETVLELIKACCSGMSLSRVQEITREILECRIRFDGINTFRIIPDKGPVRPLGDYLIKQQKDMAILEIEQMMQARFILFVDPYSTVKSMHPHSLSCVGNPTTYEECVAYFADQGLSFTAGEKPYTQYGLWLRDRADLVFAIVGYDLRQIGTPSFWERVYELTKDEPELAERHQRYLATLRVKKERENYQLRMDNLVRAMAEKEADTPRPKYFTDEWFAYKYETEKDISYRLEPDNLEKWEALVAPNGDYYSCGFGSHAVKAMYLLSKHPEWGGCSEKDLYPDGHIRFDTGRCLDALIEHGWCALRSVTGDEITVPPLPKRPTKAQIDTIFDAMVKHDRHPDTRNLL